jgi:hypothetical protein
MPFREDSRDGERRKKDEFTAESRRDTEAARRRKSEKLCEAMSSFPRRIQARRTSCFLRVRLGVLGGEF